MANKQNAWAIFLIGIALLLWQGPKIGLFSLTGITDGYIFMGKSTISWTEPTNCGTLPTQNCTVGEQVPTTCAPQPPWENSAYVCKNWYDTGQKDSDGCSLYRLDLAYSTTGQTCSSCPGGRLHKVIACECEKCQTFCDMRPYGGGNFCARGGMQFRECTFGNLQPGKTADITCNNAYWNWTKVYNYKGELCYDTPQQTGSHDDNVIFAASTSLNPPSDYCYGFFTTDGAWHNLSTYKPQIFAPHTKNLRGQNFRAEYEFTSSSGSYWTKSEQRYGGAGGSLWITSGTGQTLTLYTWPGAPIKTSTTDFGLIEINPSVINPNMLSVNIKGINVGTFDITGWPALYLSATIDGGSSYSIYSPGTGSSRLVLKNPRYQPLLSCVKEPDELLALESFSAGQELSIYSTRYAVQKFCLAHPVIVTSPTGSGTTAEPYQTWVEGRTLTVPADQTWTVFYILKNDGSLPTTCGEDAFDVKLQKCTKVSGLVQICSQGQFDPALGVCVVQPESINICPEGGRYDVSLNKCVYNPPIQYVCEQGTYDSVIGKCIFAPPSEANCPTGTEYDPIRQVCSFTPPTANVCPTGYTYNTQTGRCETNPPTSVVCPSGSTFNAATGYCEQFPLRQIICDAYYAYDSILDKCVRSPPSTILCPSGYSYDAGSDKCVRFVTTQPICDSEGGVYDSTTGLCYRQVPTQTECSVLGGTYDATKNLCVNIIETKTVCDIDGATYDASKNLCIKTVPTQNVCTTGVLSADGLVCIYTPNTETSCPRNSIYSPGENKCLYTPPTGVKCADGFTYNSGKNVCEGTAKPVCLQNGVYDERLKSCTTLVDVVSACVGGQYIIERNVPKCVMTPGNVCAAGYVFTDGKCVKSTVKPKTPITKFLSDPLFLISVTLIVASIYLYGKKGRR